MNYNNVLKYYNSSLSLDIPKSISSAILNFYNADSVVNITREDKSVVKRNIGKMFSQSNVEYANCWREYALYYLPINFYKIWRPLTDLIKQSQLKEKLKVLELGCGPGTSTLGLIEFYVHLAKENADRKFEINITVIEREKEFLKLFKFIYDEYKKELPSNIVVKIVAHNKEVNEDFSLDNIQKYDLIIESNMLNPNEKGEKEKIHNSLINLFESVMDKHSSVILIEPAQKQINKELKEFKNKILSKGFNVYSPCCYECNECTQFASAKVFFNKVALVDDLKKQGLITISKNFHSFEYLVVRKDGLKMHQLVANKISLNEISSHVGEYINFNAQVISYSKNEETLSIKICDGTLDCGKEIWFSVSNELCRKYFSNSIEIERGCYIEVKQAKVSSYKNISCEIRTKLKIMR